MLYEIRNDIQPSQPQHWKGERGARRVLHCSMTFCSVLFAVNRKNAASVSSILQLLVAYETSALEPIYGDQNNQVSTLLIKINIPFHSSTDTVPQFV